MTNYDDHTFSSTPTGPDESSARRAKRLAAVGGASLALALGGAGAAYAVGSGGDTDATQYGTIVESPTETDTSAVADREDCPEKSGGGSTAPEASSGPITIPDAIPDTSTL